ncbi:MAG: TIGR02444 family protein [Stellaceae bacterium]
MGRTLAAEAFWRFSLMIYARPGIADALIGLQDRDGHNVNLILFGVWLGLCETIRLDAAGLACAKAAIAGIDRDVVIPLRDLRRALKPDPDPDIRALRRRVLALEIAAERRVQARLSASIGRRKARGGDRHAVSEANLRLILGADFESAEALLLRRAIAGF